MDRRGQTMFFLEAVFKDVGGNARAGPVLEPRVSHVTGPELLKLAPLHCDCEEEAELLRVKVELQAGPPCGP